jgi:hypothetical protein
VAIALTIDYGLFLSVTFRESLRGAGRRAVVGGPHDSVTLTIACVGLLIIPMDAVGGGAGEQPDADARR